MRPPERTFKDFPFRLHRQVGEQPDAVKDLYFERAHEDPGVPQIWAYTDRLSYAPGETVRFHISSSLARFALSITRDGAEPKEVYREDGLTAPFSTAPEDCSVKGCGWPVGHAVQIGADWPSGAYIAAFTGEGPAGPVIHEHLFLVRPAPGQEAPLVLVCATGTWWAYNDWGGSNAYEGITGPEANLFSPVLSLERPYAKGFVTRPEGSPRIPLRAPLGPMERPHYPHMEWAMASGYSKKCASAGWASYDGPFYEWLERQGYPVDVIALHDLHAQPELLSPYRCALFVGHDEYWSWAMRDAVEAFVEAGGKAARFAGNFLWQIRMEDQGKTQVCYKYRFEEDPQIKSDQPRFTTVCWDSPVVGRPGAEIFGLNALRGVYAGWGGCAPRGSGGFTLYRPQHWAFEGTGLYYGDVIGAASRVFGYEVDGLDYIIRNGLPEGTGLDGEPEGIEILAMGLATTFETDHWGDGRVFIGPEDAEFAAKAIYGEVTESTVEPFKRGNGMIVNFKKGAGEVFHAGTCEWVAGLIDRDPFIERITRNVLDRFLGG